jgi:hypothetical protein
MREFEAPSVLAVFRYNTDCTMVAPAGVHEIKVERV